MGIEKQIENLTKQEKKILLALGESGQEASVDKIQNVTDLSQSAVMRFGLNLEEKDYLEIVEKVKHYISLTEEGKTYLEDELPERKILNFLNEKESIPLDNISEETDLTEEKAGISIGWVKRKGWGEIIEEDDRKILKISEKGREEAGERGTDEKVLEELSGEKKIDMENVSEKFRDGIDRLDGRGLIKIEEIKNHRLVLTEKGKGALHKGLEIEEEVSRLSKNLLRSGDWKEANLRDYNVTAEGPSVYPGKEHPQRRIIEEFRSLLMRMGFEEIRGPIVESEFWNFDALFQAQNHPAREIHDTLSLSKPEKANILNEDLLERVKEAHENGVAGSEGWGYEFDKEISHRPILRSQTTADTVRHLSNQPEPPVKVFCIDKVFRRERIDYQHLAEFPQAEGIVMAPDLNFRNMLGYLEQILHEMGISKIRFRPGYFPYTEPSAEADGYFPERDEWIELLGAGMFRPELLEPLGIEHPVLAWGIGFSRIAMIRMGIEDMRDLHKNDLEWLEEQSLR